MYKLHRFIVFLYLIGVSCEKHKGVYFKDINSEKFIGKADGSDELTVVGAEKAIRFVIEDLENQAEKRLTTEDDLRAFNERGWWIFRKWYELNPKADGDQSSHGVRIVYSAPDVYILMREDFCLSAATGIFRKEYCTSTSINKFRMCENKRCHKSEDKVNKKLKFIQCALAHSMYDELDRGRRAAEGPRLPYPMQPSRSNGKQSRCSRSGRRRASCEGEDVDSDDYSEEESDMWDSNAFAHVLNVPRADGRRARRHSKPVINYEQMDRSESAIMDSSSDRENIDYCKPMYNRRHVRHRVPIYSTRMSLC